MAKEIFTTKIFTDGDSLTISKPCPLLPSAYSDDGKCVLYRSDGAWIPHLQRDAIVGEELPCQRELDNCQDPFTVVIVISLAHTAVGGLN